MNPAEKIQAAIDKLEQLKADSTTGPWVAIGDGDEYLRRGDIATAGAAGERYIIAEHARRDAELIVTLHRTIDAQLAILHRGMSNVAPEREVAELLADAILGDSDA